MNVHAKEKCYGEKRVPPINPDLTYMRKECKMFTNSFWERGDLIFYTLSKNINTTSEISKHFHKVKQTTASL